MRVRSGDPENKESESPGGDAGLTSVRYFECLAVFSLEEIDRLKSKKRTKRTLKRDLKGSDKDRDRERRKERREPELEDKSERSNGGAPREVEAGRRAAARWITDVRLRLGYCRHNERVVVGWIDCLCYYVSPLQILREPWLLPEGMTPE